MTHVLFLFGPFPVLDTILVELISGRSLWLV